MRTHPNSDGPAAPARIQPHRNTGRAPQSLLVGQQSMRTPMRTRSRHRRANRRCHEGVRIRQRRPGVANAACVRLFVKSRTLWKCWLGTMLLCFTIL